MPVFRLHLVSWWHHFEVPNLTMLSLRDRLIKNYFSVCEHIICFYGLSLVFSGTDCSQPSSFHQRFSFGRGSCRRIHVCYTLASKNTSVSVSDISDCPKLDLILLGIGPDHHVASLCSNHSALNETDKWVTFIIDSPKPPPERITFTFPVIKPKLSI